jgi:hypothetical protein
LLESIDGLVEESKASINTETGAEDEERSEYVETFTPEELEAELPNARVTVSLPTITATNSQQATARRERIMADRERDALLENMISQGKRTIFSIKLSNFKYKTLLELLKIIENKIFSLMTKLISN